MHEIGAINEMFIGLSGIIGAGKTTAASSIARLYGLEFLPEPVEENPWLERFYGDMKRWSFPMQIFLLIRRFSGHQYSVFSSAYRRSGVVQDRTIYEDSIFVRMLVKSGMFDALEAETYFMAFATMRHFLDEPDAIIYLDVDPAVALKRKETRGREVEKGVDLAYMTALRDEYEEYISDIAERGVRILRLDWNEDRTLEEVDEAIISLRPALEALTRGKHNRFRRSMKQL